LFIRYFLDGFYGSRVARKILTDALQLWLWRRKIARFTQGRKALPAMRAVTEWFIFRQAATAKRNY